MLPLIDLRLAHYLYQDYHMLLLTLSQAATASRRGGCTTRASAMQLRSTRARHAPPPPPPAAPLRQGARARCARRRMAEEGSANASLGLPGTRGELKRVG